MWILGDVIIIITQSLKSEIFSTCWVMLRKQLTRIKLYIPWVYEVKPHGEEEG